MSQSRPKAEIAFSTQKYIPLYVFCNVMSCSDKYATKMKKYIHYKDNTLQKLIDDISTATNKEVTRTINDPDNHTNLT